MLYLKKTKKLERIVHYKIINDNVLNINSNLLLGISVPFYQVLYPSLQGNENKIQNRPKQKDFTRRKQSKKTNHRKRFVYLFESLFKNSFGSENLSSCWSWLHSLERTQAGKVLSFHEQDCHTNISCVICVSENIQRSSQVDNV